MHNVEKYGSFLLKIFNVLVALQSYVEVENSPSYDIMVKISLVILHVSIGMIIL